jgi:hypothetical protein
MNAAFDIDDGRKRPNRLYFREVVMHDHVMPERMILRFAALARSEIAREAAERPGFAAACSDVSWD